MRWIDRSQQLVPLLLGNRLLFAGLKTFVVIFLFRCLFQNTNCVFRAYVTVVEGLDQARRLYTAAGPQGLEGLARTRNPLGLVKQVAMCDGQRLKHEAVRMLRRGASRINVIAKNFFWCY